YRGRGREQQLPNRFTTRTSEHRCGYKSWTRKQEENNIMLEGMYRGEHITCSAADYVQE
ncbi:unnamed protein product, partial [Amoebophrya sp. A25]